MTNSIFGGMVEKLMFAQRSLTNLKKEKRDRGQRKDLMAEQVKKVLQTSDQKLILMVRS